MADNTVLNTGTGGDTIATDDVAGVKYQRVKLVDGTNDSTSVITGDTANGLDVDVTRLPALPAGTNAIGKLAANSGVDIGDVDVTSISGQAADGGSLPAVQNVIGGFDGTNTQAIITDSSGRLVVVDGGGSISVDDNSGSLTVDGTVTANAGTGPWPVTDNSGSLTVDAPVGTPAFVRLSDGTAAITALPVTDNSGSLTVDNSGTFAVQPAANSTIDLNKVAGTATDVNSGTKSAGTLRVVIATDQPALTNTLKVDPSAVISPVTITGTPSIAGTVGLQAAAAGNAYTPVLYAAQTTTVQTVKGSTGVVAGWYVWNPNASVAYVQLFNTTSAVTLGTTVPVMSIGIPPTSAANVFDACGIGFATGIKLACTTTATGSTAPSTGLDVNIFYK